MKEALFYNKKNGRVKCLLCPHVCELDNEEIGKCRVRQNIKGNLQSLSYANVSALHIDPIEKKPLYHFLPGTKALSLSTNGCVLSCLNCQNWQISQATVSATNYRVLPPDEVVEYALVNNCKSIAYTYTDPVVYYEYMVDVARLAKEKGLRNVMVSSGYINVKPLKKLLPLLDGANIDLKSFDDDIYQRLNGGNLKPVLKTLEMINESDVWLEITNLIVPQWTDDVAMITQMCCWLVENRFVNVPLHFNRFVPTYQLINLPVTSIDVLLKAGAIAKELGVHYVYLGNLHGEGYSNTFCIKCGELLIERRGYDINLKLSSEGECLECGCVLEGVYL